MKMGEKPEGSGQVAPPPDQPCQPQRRSNWPLYCRPPSPPVSRRRGAARSMLPCCPGSGRAHRQRSAPSICKPTFQTFFLLTAAAEDMLTWGWRIPFLLAFFTALLGAPGRPVLPLWVPSALAACSCCTPKLSGWQ